MDMPPTTRGRGRGRPAAEVKRDIQIAPALSQYVLPCDNQHENFETSSKTSAFKEYELDMNSNIIDNVNKQIFSASVAALQAQKQIDPFNKYKINNTAPKKKFWTTFQTNDDDEDDSCPICDRSDKNVFCKTCGHSWKVT